MPDNDDLDAYLNPPAPRSRRGSYDDLITKHATRTGLDPELVRAVVGQESGGNPRAVSPKGAQGLGQLMPATARRFNVRDVHDPDENLRGATDYLKFLNNRYRGNRDLVLAGYNAGEGAVDKYGGIPPYRETRNYVKSINARLGQEGRQSQQSQQTQKPVDDLDRYLEPAAPVQPIAPPPSPTPSHPQLQTPIWNRVRENMEAVSSPAPPRPRRRNQPPPITTALDALTQQVNQSIAQVRGGGAQGSQGVADLRRLDEPEVARIQRLQSEEAQRNPELARLRPALAASRAATRAAQRASEERTAEERQRQQAPELDRLTAVYRKQIREAQNHGIGPEQWLNEAAAKGVGGLLELGAGVVRGARYNPLAPGAEPTADKLALHAQALQRAAVEEGADRNVVSSTVQDVLAGFVSTAPELAATSIGIPAIGAFGAGGGLRAYGRGGDTREVAKGTAHGLATGAAFELPVPSGITRPLTRAAAKAGTVGAATTGVELASGAPAQQAVATGITNALFAGHGELRRGVTPRQVEEVAAQVPESMRNDPQVRELIDKARQDVRRVIDEKQHETTGRNAPAVDTGRDTVGINSRSEAVSAFGLERLSEAGGRTEPATALGTSGGSSEPISRRGRVIDERQVTTQPDVAAQPETVEPATGPDRQGRERFTVLDSDVTTTKTLSNETVSGSASVDPQPRRWLHADFGEVVESPNQRRLGKGRVRVTDADGHEHVIKRAALTGAGNQRAIPVKPELETGQFRGQSRVPDYIREAIEQRASIAERAGIADRIEDLAARRLTAQQTENAMRSEFNRLGVSGIDAREIIRALRVKRGIPSLDQKTEFTEWLQRRSQDQLTSLPTLKPEPETAPEPLDQYLEPEPATATTVSAKPPPLSPPPIPPSTEAAPPEVASPPERVFYRGTNKGDTRRIDEPFEAARGRTFAAKTEKGARLYGEDIERIIAKPGTRILDQDNAEFWKVIGRRRPPNGYIGSAGRKGETLIDVVNDAIRKAEKAGYDAISMGDSSIGTIILNEKAFNRSGNVTLPTEGVTPAPSLPREAGRSSVTERVTEPTPVPESTTSARQVQLSADRAKLDLPELPTAQRKSWQESLRQAQSERAATLADEVLASPRPLNDAETASLVVRAQQVKNQHAEAMREIGASNDPAVLAQRRAEVSALESEFDRLTEATRLSGTEKGRTLAAQKLTINQDFDLVSLKQRLKAAKGAPLTEAENTRIEDLHQRLTRAEAERDAALERASHAELQRQINRVSRQRQRTETRQSLDDEFADLKAQFAQARAAARNVQASGLAGLDPEGRLTVLIGKMARNRVRAGVTDAARLVDEIHAAIAERIEGVTKRDIRDAISGYGLESRGDRRSEDARQLAGIRAELRNLSKSEDITAGRRLSRQDATRQRQLERQAADLQRRIDTGDFEQLARQRPVYTRETYAKERAVNDLKAEFERLRYRATRSFGGKLADTAIGTANVPKTMLSMADLSAVLRQGGIGYVQHPILSARAARDMLTAFTRHGFTNVENAIKSSPEFENARRSGVEFTGVDQTDPRLTRREEGYLGSSTIDTLAKGRFNLPGKALKEVKDFSERTFVSFLDSQRMRIFEQQANALHDMGLTGRQLDAAMKSQAKYINIITGRGSLGRATQYGPALNLAMFSPRLVASRFQFLNKMLNPVAWARMPEGARRLQMVDNVKFLVGTATVLGLAKAAGAGVNLDPDDSEFLKIKVGNTRYDTLAGLQQPMRFIIRMAKAMRGGETYSGDTKGDIFADFARSKASPEVGLAWDYLEGKNRLTGKQFEPGADIARAVVPLPVQDFREAIKQDGALRGSVEALPGLLGIGVQTYLGAAEKATTPAEKLARRKLIQRMPDEARTQAEIDADTQRSQLRARSRRGEDVSADITALGAKLTERQAKAILAARNKTRLQEDFNRLGIKDALVVYGVASEAERKQLQDTLERKAPLVDTLPPDEQAPVRERMRSFGMVPGQRPRERRPRTERPERRARNRESYVFP